MAQAHVVVVAQLGEAVGSLGAQLAVSVVGQHRALEGIQEADAEVVGVALGDRGVGAGHADGRDARVLKDGAARDGNAGAVGAEHHAHVLAHQLLRGGGGLVGGGLVVGVDQFDIVGRAADVHRGLHVVGVLHAQHLLLAAGAAIAGSGFEYADLHRGVLLGHRRERHGQQEHKDQSQDLLHDKPSRSKILDRIFSIQYPGEICKCGQRSFKIPRMSL